MDYTTYTIVVEKSDDTVDAFLSTSPDGVQFWSNEEGVSTAAFAQGAEPSSWDGSLEDTCKRIYDDEGATGVYAFVQQHYPDTPWLRCEACEVETPHTNRGDKYACLVCGTHQSTPKKK
jgi:hypothetical protein